MLWSSPPQAPEIGGNPVENRRKTAFRKALQGDPGRLAGRGERITDGGRRGASALPSGTLCGKARLLFFGTARANLHASNCCASPERPEKTQLFPSRGYS